MVLLGSPHRTHSKCNDMSKKRRGSSESMETRLQAGRPGFHSRQGARMGFFFPPRYRIRVASEAHAASYSMGTGDSFPGGKAVEA